MKKLLSGLSFVAGALVIVAGCDLSGLGTPADSTDDAGAGACGTATCTTSQVCLYRECSATDRCVVSTTCTSDQTPSVCPNGQPGCLASTCAAVVQGCKAIPVSCSGDVTCACQSICGSAAACAKVDGTNIDCAGAP